MDKSDMHIHSRYSDGVLKPEAIVDRWKSEGYTRIAITDHDGIQGSIKAYEYAQGLDGIEVVPGVEFDSSNELDKDLHILGYNINYSSKELNEAISTLRGWREERNKEMLKILQDSGYDIDWEEVRGAGGGDYVAKPHFAIALVEHGYAESVSEVFAKIFKKHSQMNAFDKRTMHSSDIVRIIHEAGGVAVLAHPMEQMRDDESREEFYPRMYELLDEFRSYGIDGIECYHPSANPEDSALIAKYADKYDLMITCGSDFHWDEIGRVYR